MYFLNGEIYENEPLNNDFFYGYSLFETIYGKDGKLIFFEEHLERLEKASIKIEMRIDFDIKKEVLNFVQKKKNLTEFMVKIQVSEKNLYIKIEDFQGRDFPDGIKAELIKEPYQNEMGYIKSGDYLGNILARKRLVGFEGVFNNRQGYITEGTISNLFFVKNGVIYTPSLDLNILPGITRKKFLYLAEKIGFEVQEGHFTKEDLFQADGIFFTNSLMKRGLLWVSEFENCSKSKTQEIHKLEKEYLKIVGYMI